MAFGIDYFIYLNPFKANIMKYIPVDKLVNEINKKWKELADKGVKAGGGKYEIEIYTYLSVLRLIDSLQQDIQDMNWFKVKLVDTNNKNKPITVNVYAENAIIAASLSTTKFPGYIAVSSDTIESSNTDNNDTNS